MKEVVLEMALLLGGAVLIACLAWLVLQLTGCKATPYTPEAQCLVDPPPCVCAKLADLGCPSGLDPNCTPVVRDVLHDRIFELDAACILSAPSRVAVMQCAGAGCD